MLIAKPKRRLTKRAMDRWGPTVQFVNTSVLLHPIFKLSTKSHALLGGCYEAKIISI